ncbi:MAG: hypothetical protein QOJ42_2836 [Acidobacteriaceae bacterium]|jgi:hypothetical protein|nr:hypothetical protein [Acidobacteriaceae bacterium]
MIRWNTARARLDIQSRGKWLTKREHAAPRPPLSFEDGHIVPCLREFVSGRKPAQPSTQNQDALGTVTPFKRPIRRSTLPVNFAADRAWNKETRLGK